MQHNPVARIAGPIARFFALLCGWWLLGLALLTCVDIVGRKWFGISIQGTDEIGGYTMAVISTVGLSYALLQRSHVRIDILLMRFAGRPRAFLNLLAMVAIAAMAGYGALRGWTVLEESIELRSVSNSPLQIPLWLPQSLWLGGLLLFAVITLAAAVHALYFFFSDYQRVNRCYDPHSVLDEIISEVSPATLGESKAQSS